MQSKTRSIRKRYSSTTGRKATWKSQLKGLEECNFCITLQDAKGRQDHFPATHEEAESLWSLFTAHNTDHTAGKREPDLPVGVCPVCEAAYVGFPPCPTCESMQPFTPIPNPQKTHLHPPKPTPQTTARNVSIVDRTITIPTGRYAGVWAGYKVTFDVYGTKYQAETLHHMHRVADCTVVSTQGKITVVPVQ